VEDACHAHRHNIASKRSAAFAPATAQPSLLDMATKVELSREEAAHRLEDLVYAIRKGFIDTAAGQAQVPERVRFGFDVKSDELDISLEWREAARAGRSKPPLPEKLATLEDLRALAHEAEDVEHVDRKTVATTRQKPIP
jgi:hypothetical protein